MAYPWDCAALKQDFRDIALLGRGHALTPEASAIAVAHPEPEELAVALALTPMASTTALEQTCKSLPSRRCRAACTLRFEIPLLPASIATPKRA
jgi:hypothetical protein